MTRLARTREIDYPESDGRPMGETDLHRWWMVQIYQLLEYRYRGQEVYVGCDLLLYYVEGDPKKFVVPDNFVVLDCKPDQRRTFKLWEEQRVPSVVIEVTSRKTKKQDQHVKPFIYAQMGVQELFLYDTSLEYMSPALQGYRLEEGRYLPIKSTSHGGQESLELGIVFRLDRERLVLLDAASGQLLLTEAEAAQQERDEALRRAQELEFELAKTRARLAELENERLREELRRRDNGNA